MSYLIVDVGLNSSYILIFFSESLKPFLIQIYCNFYLQNIVAVYAEGHWTKSIRNLSIWISCHLIYWRLKWNSFNDDDDTYRISMHPSQWYGPQSKLTTFIQQVVQRPTNEMERQKKNILMAKRQMKKVIKDDSPEPKRIDTLRVEQRSHHIVRWS